MMSVTAFAWTKRHGYCIGALALELLPWSSCIGVLALELLHWSSCLGALALEPLFINDEASQLLHGRSVTALALELCIGALALELLHWSSCLGALALELLCINGAKLIPQGLGYVEFRDDGWTAQVVYLSSSDPLSVEF
jgi:hypothetical protein